MKTSKLTATLITSLIVALSLGSMPLASAENGSTSKQKPMELTLNVKTTPTTDGRVEVKLDWNDLTEQPFVGKSAEVEYTVLKISKRGVETFYQGYDFQATDTLESGSEYYYMVYGTLTNWGSNLYLTGSRVVKVSTVVPKKVSPIQGHRIKK